jgi:hypothetical protein
VSCRQLGAGRERDLYQPTPPSPHGRRVLPQDRRPEEPARGLDAPTTTPPAGDAPLLSANALYREFNQDSNAALGRYAGKTLGLEERRGTRIPLSDGGAAIHIADGFTRRALVLVFRDLREVSGISEGVPFGFRCTVESFGYLYVHLRDCSIVR